MKLPIVHIVNEEFQLTVPVREGVFDDAYSDAVIMLPFGEAAPRTVERILRGLGWPRSEAKCTANVVFSDMQHLRNLANRSMLAALNRAGSTA